MHFEDQVKIAKLMSHSITIHAFDCFSLFIRNCKFLVFNLFVVLIIEMLMKILTNHILLLMKIFLQLFLYSNCLLNSVRMETWHKNCLEGFPKNSFLLKNANKNTGMFLCILHVCCELKACII